MAPSDELPLSSPPDSPAAVERTDGLLPSLPARSASLPLDASLPSPISSPTLPDEAPGSGWRPQLLSALLVGLLAFLLASSVARNNDLWMHLASGRFLAHWGWAFPAAARPGPVLPTSHSWLFDILSYGVYSAFGGAGLIVVKALLTAALALVLLRLSRFGSRWWVAAACTALALLAMSVRLLLQPATVSYLFLALALGFVGSLGTGRAKRSSLPLASWPLLALFALWANVDGWFVLGLGVVALMGLGQILDSIREAEKENQHFRFVLFLLSFILLIAVCLLNPAHVHSFALPSELASLGPGEASSSPSPLKQLTSPFQTAYFVNFGRSPAALAYFPLLALSLLSFGLNLPRWSWRRFLPWLGLAFLSAFQVRTIPFFAVVAGPVLALNLQDYLDRCLATGKWQPLAVDLARGMSRALVLALLLVLLVCAWPGWLQSPPFEPRRWAVECPPSLERGAARMKDWLQHNQLDHHTRGLHLSPQSVYAFAWFCPESQGGYDAELASALRADRGTDAGWARRMRSAGINRVIVYDSDRDHFFQAMGKLLQDPRQWPLLHLEGYLAIFGWRDPADESADDPFRDLRVDFHRLAFHPAAADKQAPAKPPAQQPEARSWWEALWKPVPPRPVDQEEATLHLLHADILAKSAARRHMDAWECCQFAALVGAASGWNGPAGLLDSRVRLTLLQPRMPEPGAAFNSLPVLDQFAHLWQQRFAFGSDDAPPALLYLAVRSARRAVAKNPHDAQAWLVLGESYVRLSHLTRERAWGRQMPDLVQLRRCQASTAFNHAVALKPDFAQARLSLSQLYAEMSYFDLTLEHLRAYVKFLQERGPTPGVSAEQFQQQVAQNQQGVRELSKEVEKRNNKFVVSSAGRKVGDRAMMAFQEGLAAKARDLLLESDVSAFGDSGMKLELELLLTTGRAKDVLDWVGTEQQPALRNSYHLLRALAGAALGDYALAREECDEMSKSLTPIAPNGQPIPARDMMVWLVEKKLLSEQAGLPCIPDLLRRTADRLLFQEKTVGLAQSLRKEAAMTVLRGLLALEQGDVDEAEVAFRMALSVWKDAASAASGAGLDFSGRSIAQCCLQWLE